VDRVKGKTAVVTGAGSGIGEATAKVLAAEGAKVTIVDIDDANGARVADEINTAGGTARFRHLDISREDDIIVVFREAFDEYGALHVLVNNALALGKDTPPDATSAGDWDAVMDVNVRGTFLCTKHALKYMKQTGQGGSIVNVSSIMAMLGGPAHIYNTSKGAIRSLTKNIAIIYARDGIRANSVHPGYINTPLFRRLAGRNPAEVEAAAQRAGERVPLGRMGNPEDIAAGILYLASDESSYVTGSELVIDGGVLVKS
jgi:NAD(P)-dependent dehydrogenase (short-subunit alcohol dehydrogenase family)